MKFYAKVRSERAEKGQGGNEYLDIDITAGNAKNPRMLARLTVRGCENEEGTEGYGLFDEKDTLLAFLPEKEQKFTEYCIECGAQTWSFEEGVYGWNDGICEDCYKKGKRQKSELCAHYRTSLKDFGRCLDCGQRVQ